ncbi:THUMP domain-containing protein 1 [Bienertia sinuspersici]
MAKLSLHPREKKLWDHLEKCFCEANGPRLQQLRPAIIGCEQTKSMCVEDYYNTLMGLFDDLTASNPFMVVNVDIMLAIMPLNMNQIMRKKN